jgi:hypothetical protein
LDPWKLEPLQPYCGRAIQRSEGTITGEERTQQCTRARIFYRANILIHSPLPVYENDNKTQPDYTSICYANLSLLMLNANILTTTSVLNYKTF